MLGTKETEHYMFIYKYHRLSKYLISNELLLNAKKPIQKEIQWTSPILISTYKTLLFNIITKHLTLQRGVTGTARIQ